MCLRLNLPPLSPTCHFFCTSLCHVGDLPPFPTRRSSDLVLLRLGGSATSERGSQTGNRGGVSNARMVLDLYRTGGGEELLAQIVLLVVDGRPAQAGATHRAQQWTPLGVLGLPVPAPRLDEAVGDHVHRGVEVQILPVAAVRPPVADRGLPMLGVGALLEIGRAHV